MTDGKSDPAAGKTGADRIKKKTAATVETSVEAAKDTAARAAGDLAAAGTTAADRIKKTAATIETSVEAAKDTAARTAGDLAAAGTTAADRIKKKTVATVETSVEAAKDTAARAARDLAAAGTTAADRIKKKTAATVETSVEAAKDTAARTAGDLAAAGTVAAEKGAAIVRSGASGIATGFGVANETLTGFAESLDWSTIDPTKYLYAGTRGVSRGLDEARLVWESIPERLRALGPEEVAKHLDGFDWSHIVPHSKGGGNEAANGIFESAGLNRSRGAEQMTGAEIEAAARALSEMAFAAALEKVASQVFVGAAVGAAVSCVVSGLEFGLAYQRGEITWEEMYRRLGRAVARSAGAGAAISGVMAVVALAFPALIPLAAPLMMPLAILGFCAVGGKVVRLGKGWYELYREISGAKGLPDMPPVRKLPASEET